MNKDKVISILKFYRDADETIKLNERVIKNLVDQHYNTLGAMNMDGMPRGKGGTSSSVEQTALNIPRSVEKTIRELEQENKRLSGIKAEISRELNCLNYHQKLIVFDFYIYGCQWEQISGRANYSDRQCRRFRDAAIDKLGKRFSESREISGFRFPK